MLFFGTPYTRVMYGIRQCNRIFLCGEIGAFFTEIFFQISVVILNSNLHYQILKFVIDNSDISLNCLQHIQKRRNFDAKVTCHQPICLLLHAILSGVGVPSRGYLSLCITIYRRKNQNCKKQQRCLWLCRFMTHVSSLHAAIHRNFYMCVGK